MCRFRRKPTEIEAFQMTRERRQDNSEWPAWLHEAWQKAAYKPNAVSSEFFPNSDGKDRLVVIKRGGRQMVNWGDYIIFGERGQLYPCPPTLFNHMYEELSE